MASAVEHKVRKSVRYWDDAYCHTVLNHVACVVATHDPFLLGSTEFALHYHLVLFLSFFFLFSPPLSVEICFRRWFFLSQSPHPSISRCSVHKACGLLRPKRARPSNPIWKLWFVVVNFPCQSFSLHFWFGYRDTIDCFLCGNRNQVHVQHIAGRCRNSDAMHLACAGFVGYSCHGEWLDRVLPAFYSLLN